MARILITSGPTRQYLDPVRFLTNASSGRMGRSLACAAIELGHDVVIVSGPVNVEYPAQAELVRVVTTDQMLDACRRIFPTCDGMIAAAAPCDYRPIHVESKKISKTGEPLTLELVETPDVVATVGSEKRASQWMVGFALETDDHRFRALAKMARKSCSLMVLNGPAAIDATENSVEVLDADGQVVSTLSGSKDDVARGIWRVIQRRLMR